MKGTIEKALAVPLDPRLYSAFEAVQPAVSQGQAVIGQVSRQLIRRARWHPDQALSVQRTFWSRLGIAETWVKGQMLLNEAAQQPLAAARISTLGNSSQVSLQESYLRDRLILTSQNDYGPADVQADQAQRAMTALAESALVVDYANNSGRHRAGPRHRAESRPDQYVRLAAAELRPVFAQLVAFDPTAAEQYDPTPTIMAATFYRFAAGYAAGRIANRQLTAALNLVIRAAGSRRRPEN